MMSEYEFSIERLPDGAIKYTATAPIPEWMQELPEEEQQRILDEVKSRIYVDYGDMIYAYFTGRTPVLFFKHDINSQEMYMYDNRGEYGKDWEFLGR